MRQEQGSHGGCKDILQREPVVLSLFLAKGTRVDVEGMRQLQGTIDAHAVPHVTQLLNEGQGHPPSSQSRHNHVFALILTPQYSDQANDFISKHSASSLSVILFTGDAGAAPGWMRALSVSNKSVAFATMM